MVILEILIFGPNVRHLRKSNLRYQGGKRVVSCPSCTRRK